MWSSLTFCMSALIPTIQFNLNRYFSLFFQEKVRCEWEGCHPPEMEAFLLSRLQKILSAFSLESMDKQAPKLLVAGANTIGIVFVVPVCSVFRKRESTKVLCKAHILIGECYAMTNAYEEDSPHLKKIKKGQYEGRNLLALPFFWNKMLRS